MKKVLSVLLTLTMLAAAAPAHAKSSMEDVLKSVKSRIGSTEKYTDFNSDTWQDEDVKYSFYWSNDDENLQVTASDDGFISSYYYYNYNEYQDSKPSIKDVSIDYVYEKACEFVKQLNPDMADKLEVEKNDDYQSLSGGPIYFNVVRKENGIRTDGDWGSVEMSADGEQPQNFYCNYSKNVKFDDLNNIITEEEAQKAFADKIGWKLYYITDGEGKAKLVYNLNDNPRQYLSAKTGEIIELKSTYYDFGDLKEAAMSEERAAKNDAAGFTEAEQNELDGIAGLISKENAEKIVRNNKAIKLLSKYTLKYFSGYKYDDKYVYSLSFENNDGYVWVEMDAKTGKILSFNKSKSDGKATVKEDKALKAAKDTIKILEPEHTEDYVLDESSKDGYYTFYRCVNGITFYENAIYITVDMSNGNVISYSFSYDDIEFPTPENVISQDEICKKIFAKYELKPVYILNCSEDKMTKYDRATIVYNFDEDAEVYCLNAETGENYWESDESIDYTDIAGHYAENAVNELKKYGIGYANAEFKPSIAISQREFVAFAYNTLKYSGSLMISDDSDLEYYEKQAKREGIIGEGYNAEGTISREDAALILAKLMGFNKIAEISNIYNCPFGDVTKNIGQITILSGLKIINGDGCGNFNPTGILTRGDFAIILYNCLTK